MQKKVTALTLCAILITVYVLHNILGYNLYSHYSRYLIASITHANVFHLAVNVGALLSLMTSIANTYNPIRISIICETIAIAAFALCSADAVGASGFIYALLTFIYMRNRTKQNTYIMLIAIAVSFLPNMATSIHLTSMALAVCVYVANKFISLLKLL